MWWCRSVKMRRAFFPNSFLVDDFNVRRRLTEMCEQLRVKLRNLTRLERGGLPVRARAAVSCFSRGA